MSFRPYGRRPGQPQRYRRYHRSRVAGACAGKIPAGAGGCCPGRPDDLSDRI